MSETDDTDVLLLIPPNFFLIQSSGSDDSILESSRTVVHKPQSCTAQVIGKLVDQVHSLESRLENLELNSTITESSVGTVRKPKNWDTDSFDRSFDSKYFTFPRRRRRKVRKERKPDVSLSSFDSERKNVPPLSLNDFHTPLDTKRSEIVNDSPSMDGDISSIVSTPSKKNDKLLLHEIDEFLTKVEAYEAPDTKFKDAETSLSPENVIKATGDYITRKLDSTNVDEVKLPSGRVVSSSILEKYIYLVKSNPTSASEKPRQSTTHQYKEDSRNQSSETPKTVLNTAQETRSPSIRRLNFSDKDVQPTSTPKKPLTSTVSYIDTFKPSSNKIYDRAAKVLEQYKSQNYSRNAPNMESYTSMSKDEFKEFKLPQMRSFPESKEMLKNKFVDTMDTELLSLSELWGERDKGERGDSNKLEEERLKREHCEAMIQQLQKKILEQQEKLAVALRVDKAKDAAIAKLREAWLRLTGSLDKAEERHRAGLEKMINELENFKIVANEAQKKTDHFETELYKALDLAHDYQEKCKKLTAEVKEVKENSAKVLQEKDEAIARKEREIETLKENYETVMRLNKQSTDCVRNLEDCLERERTEHEVTKSRVNELNRKIQSMVDEKTIIAQERDLLKEKVNEERSRCNMLEKQLGEKQNQVCDLLKKCDDLDSDVKTLRKHLELQKNELKNHYQKQLEDAVLAKLQEFQQQLDLAERDVENDAREKEAALVDGFHRQIAKIEDQHRLEINVMEEKQREEIKLYRLQLAQASEKIGLLESKLESYRRRRTQIASQLHGVMETQWRQALQILTHSASNDHTRNHTATSTPVGQDYTPPKIPPLTLPPSADKGQTRSEHSFHLEGLSDTELQQYVKLLLTKPPNLTGSDDTAPAKDEEPTSDRPSQDRSKGAKRSLSNKPPWKA